MCVFLGGCSYCCSSRCVQVFHTSIISFFHHSPRHSAPAGGEPCVVLYVSYVLPDWRTRRVCTCYIQFDIKLTRAAHSPYSDHSATRIPRYRLGTVWVPVYCITVVRGARRDTAGWVIGCGGAPICPEYKLPGTRYLVDCCTSYCCVNEIHIVGLYRTR